jgi:hypothetical protein
MPRNEQVVLAPFFSQDINYSCIHCVMLVSCIYGCGFHLLYGLLVLQFMFESG